MGEDPTFAYEAKNNQVIFTGDTSKIDVSNSVIYGVSESEPDENYPLLTENNTLVINTTNAGLTAKNISKFDNLHFYIPKGFVAGDNEENRSGANSKGQTISTMLTLTEATPVNLENSRVGVATIWGSSPDLNVGNRVNLINTPMQL